MKRSLRDRTSEIITEDDTTMPTAPKRTEDPDAGRPFLLSDPISTRDVRELLRVCTQPDSETAPSHLWTSVIRRLCDALDAARESYS